MQRTRCLRKEEAISTRLTQYVNEHIKTRQDTTRHDQCCVRTQEALHARGTARAPQEGLRAPHMGPLATPLTTPRGVLHEGPSLTSTARVTRAASKPASPAVPCPRWHLNRALRVLLITGRLAGSVLRRGPAAPPLLSQARPDGASTRIIYTALTVDLHLGLLVFTL